MAFKNEKTLDITKEEKELDPSSEDEEELDELPAGHDLQGRELTYNYGTFPWRNMEILEGTSPAYFAEVSEFTPHKPDITLHHGARSGPVCAASHYALSRSIKAGVGSDEVSMVWTEFKRGRPFAKWKKCFTLEWKGKTYVLERAKSGDHHPTGISRLLMTHFKLIEEASGELVMLYISEPVGRRKGTMKLAASVSEELEILCVLGVASWRDMRRRRAPKGGGGGGGV